MFTYNFYSKKQSAPQNATRRLVCLFSAFFLTLHLPSVSAQVTLSSPLQTITFGNLESVAISQDGRYFASAGRGGAVIWDAETNTPVRFLNAREWTRDLTFSADGKVLVTACLNGLEFWDVSTGLRTFVADAPGANISGVAFSPEGNQIMTWSRDFTPDNFYEGMVEGGRVRLWDYHSPTSVTLAGQLLIPGQPNRTAKIVSAAYSPDGTFIVTGADNDPSDSGEVQVWERASRSLLANFWTPERTVQSVAVSTSGLIAAATADGVRTFTRSGGTLSVTNYWTQVQAAPAIDALHAAGYYPVQHMEFSADGSTLVILGPHGLREYVTNSGFGVRGTVVRAEAGSMGSTPNPVYARRFSDGGGTYYIMARKFAMTADRSKVLTVEGSQYTGSEARVRLYNWTANHSSPLNITVAQRLEGHFGGYGGSLSGDVAYDDSEILLVNGLNQAEGYNPRTGVFRRGWNIKYGTNYGPTCGPYTHINAIAHIPSSQSAAFAAGNQYGLAARPDDNLATQYQFNDRIVGCSRLSSIKVSPNGKWMAIGSYGDTLRL